MLVLCNGMPRSASTWSFNVAMGLLRSTTGQQVHGGFDENVARFLESVPPAADHIVLKCHLLDGVGRALVRTGAAKVIYTWRDVADAVTSFLAMFGGGFDNALAVMESSLELYDLHRHSTNAIILEYREVVDSPLEAVRRVARHFGLPADSPIVREIAEENSFEQVRRRVERLNAAAFDLHDPETLLHKNHILDGSSGYGRTSLTAEQLSRIDALSEQYRLVE